MKRLTVIIGFMFIAGALAPLVGNAQERSRVLETAQERIRVVVVTDELERPWSMVFLPDGSLLLTEREGRLRVIRNGVLDPQPIAGVPEVQPGGSTGRRNGLLDVALHPRFAETHWIYLTYTKPGDEGATTTALARARYDGGTSLGDVQDILVAKNWQPRTARSRTAGSRIVFGRDGMLHMAIGAPNAPASSGVLANARGGRAQDPSSHGGKVLRLHDDGSVPRNNPFVGRPGFLPEIYTLGHRNTLGLVVHPDTGDIWVSEAGPRDGDEINILRPGANYGWPFVGIGRDYTGDWIGGRGAVGDEAGRADADRFWMEGMEQPFIFWVPAVTPTGMTFYTGDRFPNWRGNLFVGTLTTARVERFAFKPRRTSVCLDGSRPTVASGRRQQGYAPEDRTCGVIRYHDRVLLVAHAGSRQRSRLLHRLSPLHDATRSCARVGSLAGRRSDRLSWRSSLTRPRHDRLPRSSRDHPGRLKECLDI